MDKRCQRLNWSLSERPGHLRLVGSAIGLDDYASPAFLGQRQEDFNFQASCAMDFEPQAENEEASLSVFLTSRHHYDLAVTLRSGQRGAILKKTVGDMQVESGCVPLQPGRVELSVRCDGRQYSFDVRQAGRVALPAGKGLARLVSPEAATSNSYGTWTGVYLALFASGNGKPCRQPADFDWFEYRATNSELI